MKVEKCPEAQQGRMKVSEISFSPPVMSRSSPKNQKETSISFVISLEE